MQALVVDDSATVRKVIRNILEEQGLDVVEAGDGSQALEALESLDGFDIALGDWNMPVMDGLEFVRAVRADDAYSEMKIMMVTTEAEMEKVVTAIEAGANEYVMKPFTPDVVLEKLRILGVLEG